MVKAFLYNMLEVLCSTLTIILKYFKQNGAIELKIFLTKKKLKVASAT